MSWERQRGTSVRQREKRGAGNKDTGNSILARRVPVEHTEGTERRGRIEVRAEPRMGGCRTEWQTRQVHGEKSKR